MNNVKTIKSKHEARLCKLKSKSKQLELLLRKRERLDFEIKTLKKSISKEQKQTLKELALINQKTDSGYILSKELISESLTLDESEDPEQVYNCLLQLETELTNILSNLLDFQEPIDS